MWYPLAPLTLSPDRNPSTSLDNFSMKVLSVISTLAVGFAMMVSTIAEDSLDGNGLVSGISRPFCPKPFQDSAVCGAAEIGVLPYHVTNNVCTELCTCTSTNGFDPVGDITCRPYAFCSGTTVAQKCIKYQCKCRKFVQVDEAQFEKRSEAQSELTRPQCSRSFADTSSCATGRFFGTLTEATCNVLCECPEPCTMKCSGFVKYVFRLLWQLYTRGLRIPTEWCICIIQWLF